MDRSKRVIFVSHCILNQNTVVYPLARAKGAYRQIVDTIMNAGIGIHQLPCPEYRYLGLKRKPMNKQEYDKKEFRQICKDIGAELVEVMREYINNDYEIIGLIGINQSPACSVRGDRGIMMEEIIYAISSENMDLKMIDISVDYVDGKDNIIDIPDISRFIE